MLKFKNITKSFKTDILNQPFVALKDVSFEIPSGSMVGFLGANGAGKTTSLKIIMDFIHADHGEVEFSKDLGTTQSEIFKNIGFLPERPYFYSNLSGFEFLNFMGSLSEMKKEEIKRATDKWAPRFKIDHALKRPLKTYSKGMLQRIGFLSTILHSPSFIILDEPLSGLDPIGRKELKDVIVEVHQAGHTVFFSSHIVSDIEEICDRVIFLKEGKLVYDGQVDDLLNSSKTQDYVVKFKSQEEIKLVTSFKNSQRLSSNINSIIVDEKNKNLLIQELLSREVELIGLEVLRPSLEEIFYQTRGKNAQ